MFDDFDLYESCEEYYDDAEEFEREMNYEPLEDENELCEDVYLKVFADIIRLAVDKGDAYDFVAFNLNEDWDGFYQKFEEVFGEKLR